MNCLYCDNCQNHVQVLTTESIFSESAPQIKALDRNLSAFSTLFAPGKSWDNVRSTTAPYTESRLTRSVANERVGFPVVEQLLLDKMQSHEVELQQNQEGKGEVSRSRNLGQTVDNIKDNCIHQKDILMIIIFKMLIHKENKWK